MTTGTKRRRAGAMALLALLAGCAVSRPPPSPDPIEGGARLEGGLGDASPSQTAFCVSQMVPLSYVVLISDGAAVRPAPGSLAPGAPDFALTIRQSGSGTTWLRQVAEAEPPGAAAAAHQLDSALADCASDIGDRP
jgi:hypothetical protein